MMKREYSCDICRDPETRDNLVGVYFSGMKKFDLRDAASTDGVHICLGCLDQLANQARPMLERMSNK